MSISQDWNEFARAARPVEKLETNRLILQLAVAGGANDSGEGILVVASIEAYINSVTGAVVVRTYGRDHRFAYYTFINQPVTIYWQSSWH